MAVAIVAMLLAAVGAGVHASLTSYAENEKLASLNQTATTVLNRIVHDVRTAAAVNATAFTITVIPPDTGTGLTQVQYAYDGATLWYRKTVNGSTSHYPLLTYGDDVQVQFFYVTSQYGPDWQGVTCTKSVSVRLELRYRDRTVSMTASAAPRRNQTY